MANATIMISTEKMDNRDDDEFKKIGDIEYDECTEYLDLGGFQLVEASKSVLATSKKGFMQSLTDGVKVKVTNIYYNMQDAPKWISEVNIAPDDCYILGNKVNNTKELKEIHENLFYFSYRDFKVPIKFKGQQFFNDTCTIRVIVGWGCTIRCAQMMFAQIIRKYQPKKSNQEIISLFLDNPSSPLSIHNICHLGTTLYSGMPGKYWNCLTAMLCLKDLYMNKLSDNNKNVDSKPIGCFTFTNNMMSFEEITSSQFGDEEIDVVPDNEDYRLSDIKPVYIQPKLIFFIGVFGGDEISSENFECMKEIFKLPSCMGMIAGVQTKAHYLIGTVGKDFMYLDPHHTQVSQSLNFRLVAK